MTISPVKTKFLSATHKARQINSREIQAKIRTLARAEREKKKTVKVGYKKLTINGQLYEWCEQEQGVVELNKMTKNY